MVHVMMEAFGLLVCFCSIAPLMTNALNFTSQSWRLPNAPQGTPPVKVVRLNEPFSVSCKTSEKSANVDLHFSPDMLAPFKLLTNVHFHRKNQEFKFRKAKARHYGRYLCKASNGGKDIELEKGLLMVKVPMQQKAKLLVTERHGFPVPGILMSKKGARVMLKCRSSVRHKNTLSWQRRAKKGNWEDVGSSMIKKSHRHGRRSLVLLIKSFNESHIYEYRCKQTVPRGRVIASYNINLFMTGYCYLGGSLHKVGEDFVSPSCDGYCKCSSENGYGCVSLCPPHGVKCGFGEMEVTVSEPVGSSNCSCQRKKCVDAMDHCYFERELYTKNQSFISKSCAECRCHGRNSVACVSLCPPRRVTCKPEEIEHYKAIVVSQKPKCVCRRQTCTTIADVCKMKPETGPCYAIFNRWHFNATVKSCKKFEYGGCSGNPNNFVYGETCKNMCQEKMSDDIAAYSMPLKLGDCKFEGQWYKTGERFISKTCREKCECKGYGDLACRPLCPPSKPTKCKEDEMKILSAKLVSNGPECHCTEKVCEKIEKVCTLPLADGPCYAHLRRWYYDKNTKSCRTFIFGGCQGNPNNFLTLDACKGKCEKYFRQIAGLKTLSISGRIIFSPRGGVLPYPSCASVKLIAKSGNGDHEPLTISFPVSDMDTSKGIPYKVIPSSKNLLLLNETYIVSAVVNVGWCKRTHGWNWVKDGDYISRELQQVTIDGTRSKFLLYLNVKSIP